MDVQDLHDFFEFVLRNGAIAIRVMEDPPPVPEREELSDSDNEDHYPAVRCELAQSYLRQFRSDNDTLGDGLMVLLDSAETISKERSCEGYYLATCSHLKKLSETRMSMDGALNNLVAHHQQAHKYCSTHRIQHVLRENQFLKETIESTTRELRQTRDKMEEIQRSKEGLCACLERQINNRYEARIRELEATLADAEADRDDIKTQRTILRQEVADLKKQSRGHRSVVAFLNKRLRAVIKSIRAGAKVAGGPKCHILGTYDDVLGVSV